MPKSKRIAMINHFQSAPSIEKKGAKLKNNHTRKEFKKKNYRKLNQNDIELARETSIERDGKAPSKARSRGPTPEREYGIMRAHGH